MPSGTSSGGTGIACAGVANIDAKVSAMNQIIVASK
jgi:hypothetical protein